MGRRNSKQKAPAGHGLGVFEDPQVALRGLVAGVSPGGLLWEILNYMANKGLLIKTATDDLLL